MQVSSVNDVKVYNLSAGRHLPQWISSATRKKLEKQNFDLQRRVELVQDFQMPDVSDTLNITPDGRYLFASGAYKPTLKCFDLQDMSLHFERGMDCDMVKVLVLSEDYSKVIVLRTDRFLEMHAAFGKYFRMRMPRVGRDMSYSKECSDLYLVGASSEIYRLNLEQGEWLTPLQTDSPSVNCSEFADQHQLFLCGTSDGTVEAWDHRDKTRVGILDCRPVLLEEYKKFSITSLKFRDALHFAAGTSTGHVLTYDLRSSRPLVVKDHNNGLAIKKLDYVKRDDGDLVLSMDSRVLKMWFEDSGKPFAAIESDIVLTDFTRYPDSGVLFFANEAPRLQQFFVPSLGTAPKWCSFLETITEELEETAAPTVYDNYKFVTKQQLEDIGLSHFIGTSVLRAYMHGYFIDERLYKKAFVLTQPFAYDEYKDRKIKDIMEADRDSKVIKKIAQSKLPKVNKDLAARLMHQAETDDVDMNTNKKKREKKKAASASAILADDRFKQLFEKTDFEIDEDNVQYQRTLKQKAAAAVAKGAPVVDSGDEEMDDEEDEPQAMLPDSDDSDVESGSDDGMPSTRRAYVDSEDESDKKKNKKAAAKKREAEEQEKMEKKRLKDLAEREELQQRLANKPKKYTLHGLGAGESTRKFLDETLEDVTEQNVPEPMRAKRKVIKKDGDLGFVEETPFGGRSMTYEVEQKGPESRAEKEIKKREQHRQERLKVMRKTTSHVAKGLKKLPANVNVGNVKEFRHQ